MFLFAEGPRKVSQGRKGGGFRVGRGARWGRLQGRDPAAVPARSCATQSNGPPASGFPGCCRLGGEKMLSVFCKDG